MDAEERVSRQFTCLRCEAEGRIYLTSDPRLIMEHLIARHQIPENTRAKQRCVTHADGPTHYFWTYLMDMEERPTVRTTVSVKRTGEDAALWEGMTQ